MTKPSDLDALRAVLAALDGVLAAAVARADAERGDAAADAFRGLHLGADDIARDLAREPVAPAFIVPRDELFRVLPQHRRLASVTQTAGLDQFESACAVLALAPDVDLRYERIYAYLQDDVTRKRPTAGLALDLFCQDAEERDQRRRALAPGARLFDANILDASTAGSSRLAVPLVLDDQILRHLLGDDGLDPRVASWCTLSAARDGGLPPAVSAGDVDALARLVRASAKRGTAFVAHFSGAHGTGKHQTAERLAARLGRSLLTADLRGALQTGDARAAIERMFRAASLQHAVAFLHGYDSLLDAGEKQALRALTSVLGSAQAPAIVAGTREWRVGGDVPLPIVHVDFDRDDPVVGRKVWTAALTQHGIGLPADDIRVLADRFRLTPAHIGATVATACAQHAWEVRRPPATGAGNLTAVDVARAARSHSGHALASLARRVQPRRCWRDLVLPIESHTMLREICARVAHRAQVLNEWGFETQLSLGKGITVLFAGPSGTGKTLAAEVVAGELQLDLFRVDLANIVSKYIGETEKNLDRVFDAAREANAVLLFDEADAIFGKRTEVRDAHDRYANLEISYLLQKMEAFDGLAILSSNMRQNIDDAFTRRLTFTVHFPFPEEADRRRIWEIIWPDRVPRADDVDAASLARELTLSGGHIKNAALAAAFYAAADGGIVTRAHVLRAARREFQKMGKVVAS